MTGNVWDLVLRRIETKVNSHTFHSWFKLTSFLDDGPNGVRVRVPDTVYIDWLTRHYAGLIDEALAEVGRAKTPVTFVPAGSEREVIQREIVPVAAPKTGPAEASDVVAVAEKPVEDISDDSAGLSARYSFETFIVGPSNQFAHAACRAVAEVPSRSYNPLYIYGGVGLGKTHLMHAIGHYVLTHMPTLKLTYISAERFMNEMINAVRYQRQLEFRERYRSIDVLMIDDVQFLSDKEGTQTELFHTFNALYDAHKQLVLSSDCPPHEIKHLEDRLRSRFEWGLIADIQPPEFETRVAIVRRMAESENIVLDDNVSNYIADRFKANIRELEGSLIRLLAYASLMGREPDISLAKEVLTDSRQPDSRGISIDVIQKSVADVYHLKLNDLKSRNNSKSVALPRQVAMFLCKALTTSSLPEIGRRFGGKHHSTVIHSIKRIEELRQQDQALNTLINRLLDSFR